jgi:hypothetical protein
MVLSAGAHWESFEGGRSIGLIGSEGGRIVFDDSHTDGARITLEVVSHPRFLRRDRISYTITCGIYGWIVHTRFFTSRAEAFDEFQMMKLDLSAIIEKLPLESDPDLERLMAHVPAELHAFISRFP